MKMNQEDRLLQRLNTGEWFSDSDVFGNPVHPARKKFLRIERATRLIQPTV